MALAQSRRLRVALFFAIALAGVAILGAPRSEGDQRVYVWRDAGGAVHFSPVAPPR